MFFILLVFMLGELCQRTKMKKTKPSKLLVNIDYRMKSFYAAWVGLIINHIWLVLLGTLAIAIFLLSGLIFVEFTTDPIKLWTSDTSRSYIEYTKFNTYFGPFYRTEQIIATLKPAYHALAETYTDVNGQESAFNQVLNKSFWPELIELQERLINIKSEGIAFEDVCLNPLQDDENTNAGGCSVFSLFEYWGSDIERIDRNPETIIITSNSCVATLIQ